MKVENVPVDYNSAYVNFCVKPKLVDGRKVFPIKVVAKGKDFVDYVRPDGLEMRCWNFDSNYKCLKDAAFDVWIWI